MVHGLVRRLAVVAAVLAPLSAPTAASAASVNLFAATTPSDARNPSSAAPIQAGVARERIVALALKASEALSSAADSVRIELFPGVAATFAVSGVEPAAAGGSVIRATAGQDGDATLVSSDGEITGRVRLKGRTYAIRPMGGRLHAISEASSATLPPPGPEILAPGAARQPKLPTTAGSTATAADDIAVVDVMFVYTAKAKAAAENINAEISLAVAITNDAYRASGVKMRMRLVKRVLLGSYDEDKREYDTVLADLAGHGPNGASFKKVRRIRDEVGADFVVLLREGGGYCGIGYVITDPAGADAWTYTTVSRGICVSVDTVAHEVGHNMGLRHDRYVTKDEGGKEFPNSQYNFGYVSLPARAMDIMAYENRCNDAGVACQYQRLFSSPKLTVNGRKFGIPAGKPGAADAVRWLNEIRWIAQDLRPTGGTKGSSAAVAAASGDE